MTSKEIDALIQQVEDREITALTALYTMRDRLAIDHMFYEITVAQRNRAWQEIRELEAKLYDRLLP